MEIVELAKTFKPGRKPRAGQEHGGAGVDPIDEPLAPGGKLLRREVRGRKLFAALRQKPSPISDPDTALYIYRGSAPFANDCPGSRASPLAVGSSLRKRAPGRRSGGRRVLQLDSDTLISTGVGAFPMIATRYRAGDHGSRLLPLERHPSFQGATD